MHGEVFAGVVICWLVGPMATTSGNPNGSGGWVPWEVTVTAYCPCKKCCGKFADGRTASGLPANGKLIAAPKRVPFDTVIRVPGYGTASVQDRGRVIRRDRLDLLFATHAEAMRFGRRKLTVLVWVPSGWAHPAWIVSRSPNPSRRNLAPSKPAPKPPTMRREYRVHVPQPVMTWSDVPPEIDRWRWLGQAARDRRLSDLMCRHYRNEGVFLGHGKDRELLADLHSLRTMSVLGSLP